MNSDFVMPQGFVQLSPSQQSNMGAYMAPESNYFMDAPTGSMQDPSISMDELMRIINENTYLRDPVRPSIFDAIEARQETGQGNYEMFVPRDDVLPPSILDGLGNMRR